MAPNPIKHEQAKQSPAIQFSPGEIQFQTY